MDGQRFDRIARELGSGRSRRSVVKGIAAGLFGVVAGGGTLRQASAGVVCAEVGQGCDGITCCEGSTCVVTTCVADAPTCVGWGESCEEVECCDGLICSSEGYCAEEVVSCGEQWSQCDYFEGDVWVECCPGYDCVEGKGYYCEFVCNVENNSCAQVDLAQEGGESSCCEGLICNEEQVCVPPPPICAAEEASCAELECCGDLICLDTVVCGYPPEVTCAAEGASCAELACCGHLTCLDTGLCGYPPEKPEKPETPIVKLPDTGAGQGVDGNEWVIPAALGAAAAAIVGGKLLAERRESSTESN